MFSELTLSWEAAIFLAGTVCYFHLSNHLSRRFYKKSPLTIGERLTHLARQLGISEYEVFTLSAKEWRVNHPGRVDADFKAYLIHNILPFYVQDYVRKQPVEKEAGSSGMFMRLW